MIQLGNKGDEQEACTQNARVNNHSKTVVILTLGVSASQSIRKWSRNEGEREIEVVTERIRNYPLVLINSILKLAYQDWHN